MTVHATVCPFCHMPGAFTQLSDTPTELHQYQCHTTQCLRQHTGEIVSTNRSPACVELARKQDVIEQYQQFFEQNADIEAEFYNQTGASPYE